MCKISKKHKNMTLRTEVQSSGLEAKLSLVPYLLRYEVI